MKIFICCSKQFYSQVEAIKHQLEEVGHTITLPNSYDNPNRGHEMWAKGYQAHNDWKADRLREQVSKVAANDAILVLNLEKNGQANYIGGATFLEMYKAFELGKPIFLYNPIPSGLLHDEISAFAPIVIKGDLSKVALP